MQLNRSLLSIIIVMGALVSLVLFLIWLPNEPIKEIPEQTNVTLILPKSTPELQLSKVIPEEIKVVIGLNNTVVWKNDDIVAHNVEILTTPNVIGEDPYHLLEAGSSFSYKLDKAGVYEYIIWPGINGYNESFRGKVIAVDLNFRPESQRVTMPQFDNPYVKITDLQTNSAEPFIYPYTGNETLDQEPQKIWILIRLPEHYGGDIDDISSFRAYSMVDIQLWCMIGYRPEWEILMDPCHGTFYEPLNGIPVSGPGKDYWIKNSALPKLDLDVDEDGYIYVKSPIFDVDKNGMIGYGRRLITNLTATFAGLGPTDWPTYLLPDKKGTFHVDSSSWKVRYNLVGDIAKWNGCEPMKRYGNTIKIPPPPDDQIFSLEAYHEGTFPEEQVPLFAYADVICSEDEKKGSIDITVGQNAKDDTTGDFYLLIKIPKYIRSWVIMVEEEKS